jgi:hypothetical protein
VWSLENKILFNSFVMKINIYKEEKHLGFEKKNIFNQMNYCFFINSFFCFYKKIFFLLKVHFLNKKLKAIKINIHKNLNHLN